MRLESLALKGLSSAFPDVVELSLRHVPPGVIAVVGENGRGKTMLLEAAPAALYRQLPARDGKDPVLYATGRDSFLTITFVTDAGTVFRCRLNLDGPKRQTDAVLEEITTNGSSVPINDGKRSTYDAAIATRFPSFDLFISSAFAAQGRGDEFIRRKPSQRKDLFVEFLGLQAYQARAQAAAEAADLANDARLRLSARIEQLTVATSPRLLEESDRIANDLQRRAGAAELRKRDLATAIAQLEQHAAVLQDQVSAYALAQFEAQRAEQALRDHGRARASAQSALAQHAVEAQTELQRLDEQLAVAQRDIDRRIANNESVRADASRIRDAVRALATIDESLVTLRAQERALRGEQQRTRDALAAADRALEAFAQDQRTLTRAAQDAELLGTVPCRGEGGFATCSFLVNAADARDQIGGLQDRLAGLEAAIGVQARGRADVADVTQQLADVSQRITEKERARDAEQAYAKLQAPLIEAETRIAELRASRDERLRTHADDRACAVDRQQQRQRALETQVAELVASEPTRNAEYTAARAQVEEAGAGNRQALDLQADLRARRGEWDTTIADLATIASGIAELERRRQEIATNRAILADYQRRLSRIETELLQWRDLAKAFGKGGLPDLEIDAAGPTISALTNEVLLECFGPRFSVELVTQLEKADGSGMRDEFTVRVMDNDARGAWRDLSDLSGGQKVIVQEALMSAISLYVNQRSPMPIRTLWRDETGAALDHEHALRYVAMLRKVQQLGGYHHVLFITHNAEAADLADAQIRVDGGRAVLMYPPFTEAA